MKYPIGIQSFESLITGEYLYIDKTKLVCDLVNEGKYYFLSRPRRFGKSLLLSTLDAYFSGKKELFKGLAISKVETEWRKYPILHLDMNVDNYTSKQVLDNVLDDYLSRWEKLYNVKEKAKSASLRLKSVIINAYEMTGMPVVFLVDEYDKPLLQTFENPALQDEMRNDLKAFYGMLKPLDQYIRFGFFTGVTKFSKVSVFSDLNNLDDITMWDAFSTVCGITEDEIRSSLDKEISIMAEKFGISKEDCYAKLKNYYDGYHFTPYATGVYNPFSLLTALKRKTFGSYWFETGTPYFLVEVMKSNDYMLENLDNESSTADLLGSLDSIQQTPIPLLFQSGYLSICGYDERFETFRLDFPNKEIEEGFTKYLVPYYSPIKKESTAFYINNFVQEIETGQPEVFIKRLESLFADGKYQIIGDEEKYFHNAVYIIFKLLGFYVDVEYVTSDGRIDLLMKTKDYIYILEFKINESAEAALKQIEDKQYTKPFESDSRKLYKIGVNFASKTRRIDGWIIE